MPNKADSPRRKREYAKCPEQIAAHLLLINLIPQSKSFPELDLPLKPGMFRTLGRVEHDRDKELGLWYEKALSRQLDYLEELQDTDFRPVLETLMQSRLWKQTEPKKAQEEYERAQVAIRIAYMSNTPQAELEHLENTASLAKKVFTRALVDAFQARINILWNLERMRSVFSDLVRIGRTFDGREWSLVRGASFSLSEAFADLSISSNGVIDVKLSPIAKALIGVDIRRLRTCKICERFFWARRLDAKCCAKRCANTYNQKLSRERKRDFSTIYREAALKKKGRFPSPVNPKTR